MCNWAAQQCLKRTRHINLTAVRRSSSDAKYQTDDCGIPLKPTWSVHQLLSSYPKPTLSSKTLTRLHRLSALKPSPEGTTEHVRMKKEVEELIRLVEAVKLVNTLKVHPAAHRARDEAPYQHLSLPSSGRELLQHASRTSNGFYIVDSEKKRL